MVLCYLVIGNTHWYVHMQAISQENKIEIMYQSDLDDLT